MNRQKEVGYSSKEAVLLLREHYPKETEHLYPYYMEYWAYPETFGNTGGPFAKEGGIYGQAITTFTIEAWVFENLAVLFCKDRVVKVTDQWKGVQTVRIN